VGSGQHLAGELFNFLAGTQILHVPFKGSAEYLSQVANGQVSMAMASIIGTSPLISAGKLKALAVTTARRVDSLPNVPTVSEFKPLAEFRHVNWVLLFGPAATPAPIVEAINKAVGAALAEPTVAKAMRERGNDPAVMTSADVQDLVNTEGARVIKLIASRNIQIER
jgi:tripartite-type tricarboxylate transporter receptor subunit TctC